MNWFAEVISDGRSQRLSSTRFNAVIAGITLCLSTLILTAIVYWRVEVVPALTVFGGALAGLAGAGVVVNKWASTKHNEKE